MREVWDRGDRPRGGANGDWRNGTPASGAASVPSVEEARCPSGPPGLGAPRPDWGGGGAGHCHQEQPSVPEPQAMLEISALRPTSCPHLLPGPREVSEHRPCPSACWTFRERDKGTDPASSLLVSSRAVPSAQTGRIPRWPPAMPFLLPPPPPSWTSALILGHIWPLSCRRQMADAATILYTCSQLLRSTLPLNLDSPSDYLALDSDRAMLFRLDT